MKIIIVAILIFIGTIPCLLFKQLNESKYGIFLIVTCFGEDGQYNTDNELRFMNHGKILSIERQLHAKIYPYAIAALIAQYLLWIPSFVFLWIAYRKKRSIFNDLSFVQKTICCVIIGISAIIWVLNFP